MLDRILLINQFLDQKKVITNNKISNNKKKIFFLNREKDRKYNFVLKLNPLLIKKNYIQI